MAKIGQLNFGDILEKQKKAQEIDPKISNKKLSSTNLKGDLSLFEKIDDADSNKFLFIKRNFKPFKVIAQKETYFIICPKTDNEIKKENSILSLSFDKMMDDEKNIIFFAKRDKNTPEFIFQINSDGEISNFYTSNFKTNEVLKGIIESSFKKSKMSQLRALLNM